MSDSDSIPDNILAAAEDALNNSLPEKSKMIYRTCYDNFREWMKNKKTNSFDEKVFLAFFHELSKKYAPPTLWSKYSMLKTMLTKENDIDISGYQKLQAYLKKVQTGYTPKKAKVFSPEEIKKFLDVAPDNIFLATKAALVIGIHGACRGQELHDLTVDNIKLHDAYLVATIPNTKTHSPRTFVIEGKYRKIVADYMGLRPKHATTTNLFISYRNGKCYNQPMGKNLIGSMPKKIATWLNLENAELYTGHSFRRSSATLLIDSGANMTTLKRHGGWKSTQVAEGYIANSVGNKRKIGKQLTNAIAGESREIPKKKSKKTTVTTTIVEKTIETED